MRKMENREPGMENAEPVNREEDSMKGDDIVERLVTLAVRIIKIVDALPETTTGTLYELRHDAAWITLNQPEKRNALSDDIVLGLRTHLQAALEDPQVRTIVLTGTGAAFCAGADLKSGGVRPGDGENPFVTVM